MELPQKIPWRAGGRSKDDDGDDDGGDGDDDGGDDGDDGGDDGDGRRTTMTTRTEDEGRQLTTTDDGSGFRCARSSSWPRGLRHGTPGVGVWCARRSQRPCGPRGGGRGGDSGAQ